MSKDEKKDEDMPKKKKGKGLLFKAMLGIGLLAIGGGGAFALMQAGLLGDAPHKTEDNNPKLIRKGEEDPYAIPSSGKEDEAVADVYGDGGSEYRTLYYSFTDEFTSNLKDSDALVQISLAASTRRDSRVVLWMRKHELSIRSALLTVLADTPEESLYSIEGKDALQKRLTGAINEVLTKHEGFGGVDAVYFRSLIIQ